MKKLILFLVLGVLLSCQSTDNRRLEKTLDLAQSNRGELEKVIQYYSQNEADSLKLKAARFLIMNMPGHYSFIGRNYENYCKASEKIIFSKTSTNKKVDKLNKLIRQYPAECFEKVEDCSIITADYLIENIDMAFEDWQRGNWAKGITFNEFCEYLLPYKCTETQAFDNWRTVLRPIANDTLQDFEHNDLWNKTSYWAAEAINMKLHDTVIIHVRKNMDGHYLYKVPFWCNIPSNSCETRTTTALAILRSKGFPVSYDFILQWATNNNAHSWLSVLTDHNRRIPCEGGHEPFLASVRPGECKGKVYRRTYSANPDLVLMNQHSSDIPLVFQDLFMKDVTDEYAATESPVFSVLSEKKESKEKYAYLTIFNGVDWTPIGFSRLNSRKKVTFEKVEKGAVYMPAYYIDGKIKPFNYPALLNERGRLEFLIPDKENTQSIFVKRKYPLIRKAFIVAQRLKGGMFQAANKEDFSDAKTLHTFDEYSVSGNILISDTTRYRYWRYFSPRPFRCNIAELIFYTVGNKKLTGEIIGSEERSSNPNYLRKAAFDLNPLSYFASKTVRNGWVGLDFGEPKQVERIGYMIRNDGNNICVGDTYELFYWDIDGWHSIEKQIADDFELTFHNVPQNALLLLKNRSRGKDERIFLYRDAKQIWY